MLTFGIVTLIIGLLLFALSKDKKMYNSKRPVCRKGHSWKWIPVDSEEEFFFLQCQECKKTMTEILEDKNL